MHHLKQSNWLDVITIFCMFSFFFVKVILVCICREFFTDLFLRRLLDGSYYPNTFTVGGD